ncbi:MAG TPA: hypothetical protein VF981_09560 [Gemmatimonadaceae bacterium]
MTRSDLPSIAQRVLLIGIAVAAMAGMLYSMQRASVAPGAEETGMAVEVIPVEAGEPIASESEVFRTRPGLQALASDTRRRPDAHPRNLATYRLLRSYPGAPPRVPHGLTGTEYRTNRCNTCHERGGFSPRFNAYAPVNPHPQWRECLQCHATDDLLVGVPFPEVSPNDACRQCHVGIPARFEEAGLDWHAAPWPRVRRGGVVPVIPHDVTLRGNCLACHMGPGAVSEIRITHPERSNCRQCHVADPGDAGTFVRPPSEVVGTGGMP